ncbi:MAG: TIGR01620 family protein [Tabrizicola sp.]|nr:TIGR01620 family protein [Tabrizicola sp.]MDP3264890.1 TIGR01620 family protein [Tabrizicola sp.]MDP3647626.1 TIGR01620 family protein [Paracoccaceae bacterium]MDZ4065980.1 TIGR01620 family protein [Tabrizicola sp.]
MQEIDDAIDPGAAPPVPDALPEGQAMQALAALSQRKGSGVMRFAVWAFGALFSFVLSVAAWDFVTNLLARNAVLGWTAFVLVAVAVLAALILAGREWAAFARMARIDGFRDQAITARSTADLPEARRIVVALTRLYAARPDTAWGRARLAEREAEVLDADALLALAERELLTPLDAEARLAVETAARQVATVTALVPLALADVAAALFSNLRMIRQIAQIYGGRSGNFGSMRLLRRVFSSLIATGAVALTDDLISSVAGGGVLSKVSRRFGEGVVNGALTARVGVAAIDICRPLPFVALERPAVSSLVSRALAGLVSRG